jgi:hypothetical protein
MWKRGATGKRNSQWQGVALERCKIIRLIKEGKKKGRPGRREYLLSQWLGIAPEKQN